jgi:hypothetical protein
MALNLSRFFGGSCMVYVRVYVGNPPGALVRLGGGGYIYLTHLGPKGAICENV